MTLQKSQSIPERFTVHREVMQCRFSILYDATDTTADGERRVLLRRISPNAAATDAYPLLRAQLLREAALLSKLDSPHLPHTIDVIRDADGDITVVYEHFEAHPIDYVVSTLSGSPGQHVLGNWMHQTAGALRLLHEHGKIYRDLRPQTMMLSASGRIMLTDFGLAWMGQKDDEDAPLRGHGLVQFAPPEQLLGQPPDPRMDLYALGATFYYLASTRKPPPAPERVEHGTQLDELDAINPRIVPQFARLCEQLMALAPEDRPVDIASVQDLLDVAEVASAIRFAIPPPAAPPVWSPPTLPGSDSPSPAGEAPPTPETSRSGLLSFLPWRSRRTENSRVASNEVTQNDLDRYPHVDLASFPLDRELASLLPESVSRRVEGICIGRVSGREITLAVRRPDVYIYDHISYASNGELKPRLMLADARLIELAQEYVYRVPERQISVPWKEWLEKKRFHGQDLAVIHSEEQEALLLMEDAKGPAVETVDRIIKEAISIRASDVHIETYESDIVLRYRVDGLLRTMDVWPRREAATFVKRIKILANMDIAQEMIPQGGRISVRVSEHEFDLRVSCLPVPDGESIVMRLLPKGTFDMNLEGLGFSATTLLQYRKLTSQPHGMLLVSGPTGSGKSTTLYATLAEINTPDRKILTVEDPIEYKMHGVVQVQVNVAAREEEKRLTFARALREFLRSDPDVILVGEIRDDETAAISVQAALTGHLLLSTVHTNDAVTIIPRLRDRGVEPFLISSTLLGGIAQRLVRKICVGCKEEVPLHPVARRMFEAEGIEAPRVFTGKGCEQCHRSGYRGRIAIYEVLEVNDEISDMIANNCNAGDIARTARQHGMRTLFQDGLEKVRDGVVTLEEVKRVCMTM